MGTTTFLTRTSSGSIVPPDVPMHIVKENRDDDITSTRPWDGDHPPRSIYADSVFIRRGDGIWCKRDTAGGLYPVNINGERCAKPRNRVLDLILVMDNVDPVLLVLTHGGI